LNNICSTCVIKLERLECYFDDNYLELFARSTLCGRQCFYKLVTLSLQFALNLKVDNIPLRFFHYLHVLVTPMSMIFSARVFHIRSISFPWLTAHLAIRSIFACVARVKCVTHFTRASLLNFFVFAPCDRFSKEFSLSQRETKKSRKREVKRFVLYRLLKLNICSL